jgi:cytochrome P450
VELEMMEVVVVVSILVLIHSLCQQRSLGLPSCRHALLRLHYVVTSDMCNLEHLLKNKFVAEDEVWRSQRKVASPEFHFAEFRTLTAELVHRRLLPVLGDITVLKCGGVR